MKPNGKNYRGDKIFKVVLEQANPKFVKIIKPKTIVTIKMAKPGREINENIMSPHSIIDEYEDQNLDLI